MKNIFFKLFIPVFIAFSVFSVILYIYFLPVTEGKMLVQSDVIQIIGSLKESSDYQKKTGEEILWTGSTFSGMPVWRGHGANILGKIHAFFTTIFPIPVYIELLAFIGFYILLSAFEINPWLCFAGGAAFAFSSFNMISLEAGHINKVLGMALMAPVIGGIIRLYRGKLWSGAAITTAFLSFQVFYNHIQISYYLMIIILFLLLAEFYTAWKQKRVPAFFRSSVILAICTLIAIGPNISRLWTTSVYAKSTPRSGSELSTKKAEGNGLDKDYTFQWSNGIMETMTILIPSFYGGSSHEEVGQNSNIYKSLLQNGVQKKDAREYSKSMPLYWGDQQFTSGPVYFGAIICFLFVLGLFLVKGPLKWWIIVASVLSIVLSWGKNFELLSDFFFYYIPLYNKFRSVTMILSIAQLTFPLLAFIILNRILNKEIDKAEVIKALKFSFYITGGITLFFALLGSSLFEFSSANDAAMKGQFPDWLMEALREDRISNFRTDAIRSFIFILVSATILWAFIHDKLKVQYVYIAFPLLVLADMWGIDKRYLNNDDFKFKKNYESQVFVPSAANETILQDPDPDFRVFNYTAGITSDAITSYFHKSVGGYSAIKLRRYQDLIDSCLSRGNRGVFNMLNTKYYIGQDKNSGQTFAQRNPEALGNAWFVPAYRLVNNADEEINSLKNIEPKDSAYIDKIFADQLKGVTVTNDSTGKIKLISYHPHKLVYESENRYDGLGIFSEIYYQPGWNAYIDGKLTPHLRADYVLRGLVIPKGKHQIEFKFEPQYYYTGEKISYVGSMILLLFIAGCVFMAGKNYYQNESSHPKHV